MEEKRDVPVNLKLLPEEDLESFWIMQGQCVKKYPFSYVKKDYAKNKKLYVGCYEGKELVGIAYGFILNHFRFL